MTDRAREVLNALMGIDRDLRIQDSGRSLDEDICKYMLVAFCPFMLFRNTKRSIGKCRYSSHEEYYRAEYVRRGSPGLDAHEWDFVRLLVEIVLRVQRGEAHELPEAIRRQEELFNERYREVEAFGMDGNVEDALESALECERLKEELEKSKETYYVRSCGAGMERCGVCGANVTLSDTCSKIEKHLEGRVHRGYVLVRRKLAELLKRFNISGITDIFPEGVSFKYVRRM